MKIEPGKYFEIAYKLYRINDDGTEELVHEVDADNPDRVIDGMTVGFIEALEKGLAGKQAGDSFDITANPEEAFGPYSQEDIYRIPRENMMVDGKFDEEMFAPGEVIPLRMADGFRVDGVVLELTPTDVVLDLNHPLAMDKVHFVGEVLLVREPTAEELHPHHCCCGGGDCGGGDCGGGDCGGGSCGDGCCCG